jgi:hypothetical protein
MDIKGAGGTRGGIGSFFIGFIMMCAGVYMLLQSIIVTGPFGFGYGLYSFAAFGNPFSITSGMIIFPFILGIGMIFFNGRFFLGWLIAVGSLGALIAGVIMNTHFTMKTMTLFDLLTILILTFGGLGLFLRSLQNHEPKKRAA